MLSPSPQVSKMLCEAFLNYVSALSKLIETAPQLPLNVYAQFFDRLEKTADPGRLYYLLTAYLKIDKGLGMQIKNT